MHLPIARLTAKTINEFDDGTSGCDRLSSTCPSPVSAFRSPIAEMVLVFLGMPCSEAEVERVFAHLRRLFGDHAQHSRGDLVEARLTIMMNNLDVTREFMRALPGGA
jgi:hypothetical protein